MQDSADIVSSQTEVSDSAAPCEQAQGGGGKQGSVHITTSRSSSQPASKSASSVPLAPDLLLPSAPTFSDIDQAAWYWPYVTNIASRGIVSGYKDAEGNLTGLFGPENPVTYAELAKIVLSASDASLTFGNELPQNLSARNTWASAYIRLAEDRPLSVFTSSLNVGLSASRAAVVQSLLEAFDVNIDAAITHSFTDLPSAHPHRDALATAAALGIIGGDTLADGSAKGTVRPDDPINRAEVSKLIVRMLEGGARD